MVNPKSDWQAKEKIWKDFPSNFTQKVHKMCPARSQVYRAALESPALGAFIASKLAHLGLTSIARFKIAGEQMIHNFFRRDFCHLIFNFVATLTLENSIDQLQAVEGPELVFVCLRGCPMSTRRSINRKNKVF